MHGTRNLTKNDVGYGGSISSFFNSRASPSINLGQYVQVSLGQFFFKRL
jgi:hypothetical protein